MSFVRAAAALTAVELHELAFCGVFEGDCEIGEVGCLFELFSICEEEESELFLVGETDASISQIMRAQTAAGFFAKDLVFISTKTRVLQSVATLTPGLVELADEVGIELPREWKTLFRNLVKKHGPC